MGETTHTDTDRHERENKSFALSVCAGQCPLVWPHQILNCYC